VPIQHEALADGELALGVRPEHVRLVADGGVRGVVFGSEYMGTLQVVTIDTDHGRVKARISSALRVHPGEPVGLRFADDRTVLFDTNSGRALRSALFAQAA
jgi:multiple sugar transport system ATP-binding protein